MKIKNNTSQITIFPQKIRLSDKAIHVKNMQLIINKFYIVKHIRFNKVIVNIFKHFDFTAVVIPHTETPAPVSANTVSRLLFMSN